MSWKKIVKDFEFIDELEPSEAQMVKNLKEANVRLEEELKKMTELAQQYKKELDSLKVNQAQTKDRMSRATTSLIDRAREQNRKNPRMGSGK